MVSYRIDPTDALPLHHQLQRQLRSAIRGGDLRPGDMLPPELLITQQTGLSRTTVRRAMDDLVHEGLIIRERGRGTFVAQPRNRPSSNGRTVVFAPPLDLPRHTSRLLGMDLAPAESSVGTLLGLEDRPVLQITRLLLCANAPCAVERIALPPLPWTAAGDAALNDQRLLELLEASLGVYITHAQVRIVPVALDEETAAMLQVTPGLPGLLTERQVFAGARVVEHRRLVVYGDTAGVEIATPREVLLA